MSEVRLLAEIRTEFGKGGARRTRRAGKIPAVLYGHGTDPRHLSLPARDFSHALKGGANTVLGPFLAAVLLGVVDVAGKYWVPELGAFAIYTAMVALLLVRPQGLLARAAER